MKASIAVTMNGWPLADRTPSRGAVVLGQPPGIVYGEPRLRPPRHGPQFSKHDTECFRPHCCCGAGMLGESSPPPIGTGRTSRVLRLALLFSPGCPTWKPAARLATRAVCHARETCERSHANADRMPQSTARARDARVASPVRGRLPEYPEPRGHLKEAWPRAHGADARKAMVVRQLPYPVGLRELSRPRTGVLGRLHPNPAERDGEDPARAGVPRERARGAQSELPPPVSPGHSRRSIVNLRRRSFTPVRAGQ